MSDEPQPQEETEIRTPFFSAKIRGKDVRLGDLIMLGLACGLTGIGMLVWQITEDHKAMRAEFAKAVAVLSEGQQAVVAAQLETNYLMTLDPAQLRQLNLAMPLTLRQRLYNPVR